MSGEWPDSYFKHLYFHIKFLKLFIVFRWKELLLTKFKDGNSGILGFTNWQYGVAALGWGFKHLGKN